MFPIFFTIWYNTRVAIVAIFYEEGGTQNVRWDKMESIDLGKVINLQNKLVPEMVQLLTERYSILRQISHDQPIGRRSLARKLSLSERVLRSHVDFLKEAGLLEFGLTGMTLTEEGKPSLQELRDYQSSPESIFLGSNPRPETEAPKGLRDPWQCG